MAPELKALHLITRPDPGGSAANTLLTCRYLHVAPAGSGRSLTQEGEP